MNLERERSLFEEWALERGTWSGHGLRRNSKTYIVVEVEEQWCTWRARAAIEEISNLKRRQNDSI